MKLLFGDRAAQIVSGRVAQAETSTTTIKAIPASRRVTGMLCVDLTTTRLWIFDGARTDSAGANILVPDAGSGVWVGYSPTSGGSFKARGVVTANVADLTAFTVASNDGLTYAAGERVLLTAQTTAADCGLYIVGTVASTTAPLTRAPEMPSGLTGIAASIVQVSEGTIWRGSQWKAMVTGTPVIGTNDPLFYPQRYSKTVTLSSGTYVAGAGGGSEPVFLFSTTTSSVQATRNTAGGTLTSTTHYYCPAAGRTAGKAGTGAVTVTASVAAGTINAADNSTMDLLVINW